jgi:Mur ligase family, glutamate ligase domain
MRPGRCNPVTAAAALAGFGGARRRMERVGETPSGATVYDDYAHHPTEVPTAAGASWVFQPHLFQPHSYPRTRARSRLRRRPCRRRRGRRAGDLPGARASRRLPGGQRAARGRLRRRRRRGPFSHVDAGIRRGAGGSAIVPALRRPLRDDGRGQHRLAGSLARRLKRILRRCCRRPADERQCLRGPDCHARLERKRDRQRPSRKRSPAWARLRRSVLVQRPAICRRACRAAAVRTAACASAKLTRSASTSSRAWSRSAVRVASAA